MQQKSSKEMTGTVRDQQGRQRFHGAFTGGFSAGYFNTVGSAEGFKPAQFVSSRSNRAAPLQRTAKDFMDEEDGLLGGSLLTKQELDSFKDDGAAKDTKQGALSAADRVIMDHFILQPSNTIGKKLLTLLGWKVGIAIGPRKKKKVDFGSSLPSMAMDEGFVTFAPRLESQSSTSIHQLPRSKADTKGLGYEESLGDIGFLRRDNAKSQEANRYHMKDLFRKPSSSTNKATTAYLDEDEDIAFDDSGHDIPQCNAMEVDEQSENFKANNSLSSTSKIIPASYERCPSDNRVPLTGFHVASRGAKVVVGVAYPPPVVPKDFTAYHTFTLPSLTTSSKTNQQGANNRKSRFAAMDVLARRQEGLSDEKKDTSVFGLLKHEDRLRIQALAASVNSNAQITAAATMSPQLPKSEEQPPSSSTEAVVKERPLLVSSNLLHSKFAALSQAFKSRFTTASSSSSAAAGLDNESQGGITSAESLKELQNNKAALASFESSVEVPKKGSVKRTTVMWAPSSLLCKRCNVKTPDHASVYRPPGSAISTTSAVSNGGDDMMQQMFQAPPQPPPSSSSIAAPVSVTSTTSSTTISTELQRQFDAQDVYQIAAQPPPMDVFKSIFADSDSDEEDVGKDENEGDDDKNEEKITAPVTKELMLPPPAAVALSAIVAKPFHQPLENNNSTENVPKKEETMIEPSLPTYVPKSKRSTTTSTSSLFKLSNSNHKSGVIATTILSAEDDDEDLPDPSPIVEVKPFVKQNKRLITTTNDDEEDDERKEQRRNLKRKKMTGNKESGTKKKVKLSFCGDDEEND